MPARPVARSTTPSLGEAPIGSHLGPAPDADGPVGPRAHDPAAGQEAGGRGPRRRDPGELPPGMPDVAPAFVTPSCPALARCRPSGLKLTSSTPEKSAPRSTCAGAVSPGRQMRTRRSDPPAADGALTGDRDAELRAAPRRGGSPAGAPTALHVWTTPPSPEALTDPSGPKATARTTPSIPPAGRSGCRRAAATDARCRRRRPSRASGRQPGTRPSRRVLHVPGSRGPTRPASGVSRTVPSAPALARVAPSGLIATSKTPRRRGP